MTRLGSFFRHRWSDRLLLIEAVLCLGIARLAVLSLSFKRIAPHLGRRMAESTAQEGAERAEDVRRVSWALARAGQHAPWDCNCLTRALAGKLMLRRRRIRSTLYLGVADSEEEGGLHAHAWLRSGDIILSGARKKDAFTVVSTFAD